MGEGFIVYVLFSFKNFATIPLHVGKLKKENTDKYKMKGKDEHTETANYFVKEWRNLKTPIHFSDLVDG